MKARLMMISSALLASLICLPAMAQPAPQQGMGPGMGMSGMSPVREWARAWVLAPA